jgi:hypothetical protein
MKQNPSHCMPAINITIPKYINPRLATTSGTRYKRQCFVHQLLATTHYSAYGNNMPLKKLVNRSRNQLSSLFSDYNGPIPRNK